MLFFVVTAVVPIFEVLQTFNEAVEKVHRQYDDLRRQEQQLRESEERLRFAQKAELVQMSFVDITHPDDVRADVELAERLFKREMPFYRTQKRYVKKSGDIIWINLTASIILGSDGRPLHGLAMVEDITEIKRTQEEALFRQKLESVGTLAGGIAHDFNNLLGAVQAQAELASAELDGGSSCTEEL